MLITVDVDFFSLAADYSNHCYYLTKFYAEQRKPDSDGRRLERLEDYSRNSSYASCSVAGFFYALPQIDRERAQLFMKKILHKYDRATLLVWMTKKPAVIRQFFKFAHKD